MNFFQLYIGYIGASRAYGIHLEILDVALFLTNHGVTFYWGHAHRWSRRWLIKAPAAAPTAKPSVAAAQAHADANQPQVAAAASGLLGTGGAVATSIGYAPALSVVPLHTAKAAKSARQSGAAADRKRISARERAPARVMAG